MGKIFGRFDKVIEYGQESIDSEFRAAHEEILDVTRGNGLWLWKPYIIYKTLEQVNNGDYIFYCDSGAFFFRSVSHFLKSINESKSDIWVTDIAFINRQWTKPKVFELLGISSREDIKNSRQVQGGFVFVRKSQESINFIREWLELVQRPELITPLRPDEDYGECIEHREDQSLLSIVSKLRGVKPHKEPYIAPSYHSFRELIKDLLGAKRVNAIKKFLGKKITPAQPHKWAGAIKIQDPHIEDKYPPCIFLHRIRRADSIASMIKQAVKLFMLRNITSIMSRIHNFLKYSHADSKNFIS